MKAWQRQIREKKSLEIKHDMFDLEPKIVDIKTAIVKEVDLNTAKKIILEYEWLGTMGMTDRYFGIFFDGYCAGVVCYGALVAMMGYDNYVGTRFSKAGKTLARGACVHWAHPHSASKLISNSLNILSKEGVKWVVAYSDPEAGEVGTVYQATNWFYIGFGNTKHFALYDKKGKLYIDDADYYKRYMGIPYKEFAKKHNLEIRVSETKGRYIKLLGNKSEQKYMLSFLKDKICQYPKRSAEEESREIRNISNVEGLGRFQPSAQTAGSL